MLRPSRDVDQRGTVIDGMRVITPAKLDALKEAFVAYADENGRWSDDKAVAEQLAHHHLTVDEIIPTFSEPVQGAR